MYLARSIRLQMSYAKLHGLRLVFIVLGKPWAIYLLRETLKPKKTSQAVLLQTWVEEYPGSFSTRMHRGSERGLYF